MNPILKSLLIIGLVATVGGTAVTAAYFTSQIVSGDNTVTTGTLSVLLNTNNDGALAASNMYPGSFVETAAAITNNGTIRINPSLSLTGANDPSNLAPNLYLEVWTNGKIWYTGPLTSAPGYTTNKVTLNTINPAETIFVAIRLTLNNSATTGGTYKTKVAITGYQWNDPDGAITPFISDSTAVVSGWSYNVCGVSPLSNSPWYTFDAGSPGWRTQTAPDSAHGTQSTGDCVVP